MAEYIDKEKIERVRLEDSCYIIEHFKGDEIDCIIDAPTEDVIEREKIDKAIDEIIDKSFISDIYNDRTDDEIIKLDDVLEILKRNIGE